MSKHVSKYCPWSIREDLKQHFCDDRARKYEYLLSKANLESDAGKEEKVNAIKNIRKAERRNQYYCNFNFHERTGITSQEINRMQIPM